MSDSYETFVRAKYDAAELRKLGDAGHAMKVGETSTGLPIYDYPTDDADDWGKAKQAVGRGGADHDAIRKYLIAAAKRLGISDEVPENWNADGSLSDDGTRSALDDLTILRRSMGTAHLEGRTLSGLAIPFNVPALVKDPGTPAYWEAHSPSSFDRTLHARAQMGEPFPLFVHHDWMIHGEPIGTATFRRSAGALMYEAPLSKTRKADEALELVRDGALLANSVGFRARAQKPVRMDGKVITMRTENELRELSLAPTGMGQFPGSRVLAIRAGIGATFSDISDGVSDAIGQMLYGKDGPPDGVYLYIIDISTDGWAVYNIEGGALDEANVGRFQCEYTVADDGDVTVTKPVPVKVSYVPIERSDGELKEGEHVRTEDPPKPEAKPAPLPTGSSTPRLDAARRRNALLGREGVREPVSTRAARPTDEDCGTCGQRMSRHVGDLKLCPVI